MSSLRGVFSQMFTKHLLVTNTVACGALMGVGDLVVQCMHKMSGKTDRIDFRCTGRMTVYGLSMGPVVHHWYKALDRLIPGSGLVVTTKKILPDQIIASPFLILTFFMGLGTLEGKRTEDSFDDFKTNFWTVYKFDWSIWPAAQFINFLFLPPKYRVVYVSAVTLVWNIFLAYIKHKGDTRSQTHGNSVEDLCITPNQISNTSKKL